MNAYEKAFTARGYKVVKLPFHLFANPYVDAWNQDAEKHRDPMYRFKNDYTGVDVIVTNNLYRPFIVLTNPSMIK